MLYMAYIAKGLLVKTIDVIDIDARAP